MNPIVSENFSTCSATSRSRRTSDALCAVVTPRSVSRRTASAVAWRILSVVFSISAPDSRVWSPAVATSPACCLSWSDSRVTALTRLAACLAPWLARCAAAATSWLDAWICCVVRSEEHTSELQSHVNLVCRLLLEKKKVPAPTSEHPAGHYHADPG